MWVTVTKKKILKILSGVGDNYIPPYLLIFLYNADVRFSTVFSSFPPPVARNECQEGTKHSLRLFQPKINSEKKWYRQANSTGSREEAWWLKLCLQNPYWYRLCRAGWGTGHPRYKFRVNLKTFFPCLHNTGGGGKRKSSQRRAILNFIF